MKKQSSLLNFFSKSSTPTVTPTKASQRSDLVRKADEPNSEKPSTTHSDHASQDSHRDATLTIEK